MPDLIPQTPPFRNDAPPWYNNGIWGKLGSAVPQTGQYLHTQNQPIWKLVDLTGRQLFNVLWSFDDRLFEGFLSRECAWEVYRLIVIGRQRIADKTVQPGKPAPMPTKAKPAYDMFRLYPVPFYGEQGCRNAFLYFSAEQAMLMLTECMGHSDNERAMYVTPEFGQAVSPYLQNILIELATTHFGYSRDDASDPAFVIPDIRWGSDPTQGYNPAKYGLSVEATSERPPPGYRPTAQDLMPIKALPAEEVVPFCQPWPDQQLQFSPGGVWTPMQGAASDKPTTAAATQAAFPVPPGPPAS